MKTFSQFINENSQSSQYADVISKFMNGMRRSGWNADISVEPNGSIKIDSTWEIDTMKISGLGRVEPSAYFTMVLQPNFTKQAPEKLTRLIQLGLGTAASLLEGFTITTSLLVEVYEVEGYEYAEGPDTDSHSLKDLGIDHYFENGDIEGAGESFMEWWNEAGNEYGYMLYTSVAEDLEEYVATHQSDEDDDEEEEEEDDEDDDMFESYHDKFRRLHQLGLAEPQINIQTLDGDESWAGDQANHLAKEAADWTDRMGHSIVRINGQLSEEISMLVIELSDGSIVELDARYHIGPPGISGRDYCRIFIKSSRGEFNIDYTHEDDRYIELLADTGSILRSVMTIAKPYL